MSLDRYRISALNYDRYRISETSATPVVQFAPSNVGVNETGLTTEIRQWNIVAGAANTDEGNLDAGGYIHRESGMSEVRLLVRLDFSSAVSTSLAYTVAGTAIAGTHYTLLTPSPITVPAGQTTTEIIVDALDPGKWFSEKSLTITLDAASVGLAIDPGGLDNYFHSPGEYRLYFRPASAVPTVDFNAANSTEPVGGPYQITLDLSAASLDDVTVHYRETGTIDAGDYTITVGDESGSMTIAAGATTADLDFTIGAGASSSETLIFTLNHELNTREHDVGPYEQVNVDENQWHFTADWNFETGPFGVGQQWPADPTMHGNAGLSPGQTLDVPHGETSLEVLDTVDTTPALTPNGDQIQGIVISKYINTNTGIGYVRESFEDQFKCGGPTALTPLLEYNRFALRFAAFSGNDSHRNARFFKYTFRVRTLGSEHEVVIDRESTGEDYQGNATTTWPMGTETWGLWWSSNIVDDDGITRTTFGAVRQRFDDDGGTVASGGTEVNTFWLVHQMGGKFTVNGTQVTETSGGVHSGNMILRPVQAANSDGTVDAWKPPKAAVGEGMPVFWPWFETSASVLSGAPTKYWSKRGRWWEPRGKAALVSTGQNTHTFTVT